MNAILRARLAKPAPPQPSSLHNARGIRECDLLWWVRRRWHIAGILQELQN